MKPPYRPLEREVQRAILQWLSLVGILAWRQNSGAVAGEYKGKRRLVRFCSMPGISDIIGILPERPYRSGCDQDGPEPAGRLLACEVKRPGGRLSADQAAFLDAVNRAGGLGVCVDGLDALRAVLAAEGYRV